MRPQPADLHVVATFHPSPLSTPNATSGPEGLLHQPMVFTRASALRRYLARSHRSMSPRCYAAEHVHGSSEHAGGFRPVLRLRLSRVDMDETADDGSAPGIDEVSAYLDGTGGLTSALTPRS
jgi:hypothetical protein